MPPLARITGTVNNPPISISLGAVTVTATSTGYKAKIEPPTGKTAKELLDELPQGADIFIKDNLNAADATLKVTAVGFCVEPSDGSACAAGSPPAGPPPAGGGDDPCFSREAEACRNDHAYRVADDEGKRLILDTFRTGVVRQMEVHDAPGGAISRDLP